MDDPTQATIAELRARLEAVEERLGVFERMRLDEASGGGQLTVSGGSAVMRVNALTDSGQQLP